MGVHFAYSFHFCGGKSVNYMFVIDSLVPGSRNFELFCSQYQHATLGVCILNIIIFPSYMYRSPCTCILLLVHTSFSSYLYIHPSPCTCIISLIVYYPLVLRVIMYFYKSSVASVPVKLLILNPKILNDSCTSRLPWARLDSGYKDLEMFSN